MNRLSRFISKLTRSTDEDLDNRGNGSKRRRGRQAIHSTRAYGAAGGSRDSPDDIRSPPLTPPSREQSQHAMLGPTPYGRYPVTLAERDRYGRVERAAEAARGKDTVTRSPPSPEQRQPANRYRYQQHLGHNGASVRPGPLNDRSKDNAGEGSSSSSSYEQGYQHTDRYHPSPTTGSNIETLFRSRAGQQHSAAAADTLAVDPAQASLRRSNAVRRPNAPEAYPSPTSPWRTDETIRRGPPEAKTTRISRSPGSSREYRGHHMVTSHPAQGRPPSLPVTMGRREQTSDDRKGEADIDYDTRSRVPYGIFDACATSAEALEVVMHRQETLEKLEGVDPGTNFNDDGYDAWLESLTRVQRMQMAMMVGKPPTYLESRVARARARRGLPQWGPPAQQEQAAPKSNQPGTTGTPMKSRQPPEKPKAKMMNPRPQQGHVPQISPPRTQSRPEVAPSHRTRNHLGVVPPRRLIGRIASPVQTHFRPGDALRPRGADTLAHRGVDLTQRTEYESPISRYRRDESHFIPAGLHPGPQAHPNTGFQAPGGMPSRSPIEPARRRQDEQYHSYRPRLPSQEQPRPVVPPYRAGVNYNPSNSSHDNQYGPRIARNEQQYRLPGSQRRHGTTYGTDSSPSNNNRYPSAQSNEAPPIPPRSNRRPAPHQNRDDIRFHIEDLSDEAWNAQIT